MSNWTLITAYFNLKDRKDATGEVRPVDYYLNNGRFTMSLDKNMVIFCDKVTYLPIWKMRKEYGSLHRTYFVVIELNELTLYKYYDKIVDNRKNNQMYVGHRNTPSYFILVTSKFTFLEQSIKSNPFDSTHFAWIDFGIYHVQKIEPYHVDRALSVNRDKNSMCYINNTDTGTLRNYPSYYSFGRCGTAAGFMTGRSDYMLKLCSHVYNRFVQTVEAGYGHSEEQFLPQIHLDHPDLFEFYYGDYGQVIINYDCPRENIDSLIRILIGSCRSNATNSLGYDACVAVTDSYKKGLCSISDDYIIKLYEEFFTLAWWSGHQGKCSGLLREFTELCNKSPNVEKRFTSIGTHMVKNSDYLQYIEPRKCIAIHGDNVPVEFYESELTDHQVFIYGNYPVTPASLKVNNPVIRPNHLKFDTSYLKVLSYPNA